MLSSPLVQPAINFGSLTVGSLDTKLEDLGQPALAAPDAASVDDSASVAGSAIRKWGVTPLPSTKLSIKEMMEQAATPRQSGLSLGLTSHPKLMESSSASFKASQKERKQMQRFQSDVLLASQPESSSPKTPWQLVSPGFKTPVRDESVAVRRMPSPALTTPAVAPLPDRPAAKPQLTMRQTVANAPSTPKQRTLSEQRPAAKDKQRSVSTPQATKVAAAASSPLSPGIEASTKAIPIQSVRHQPRPEQSPSFYMHQSMADILCQQQAEKISVKEAVAKRSLQEIQQEQEFQVWWEQESQRVLEEEAATARLLNSASSGSKSKGGSRGGSAPRGRGRARRGRGGKEKTEAAE